MVIKRFIGDTEADAYKKAEEDLGDYYVLNVMKVPASYQCELTAAVAEGNEKEDLPYYWYKDKIVSGDIVDLVEAALARYELSCYPMVQMRIDRDYEKGIISREESKIQYEAADEVLYQLTRTCAIAHGEFSDTKDKSIDDTNNRDYNSLLNRWAVFIEDSPNDFDYINEGKRLIFDSFHFYIHENAYKPFVTRNRLKLYGYISQAVFMLQYVNFMNEHEKFEKDTLLSCLQSVKCSIEEGYYIGYEEYKGKYKVPIATDKIDEVVDFTTFAAFSEAFDGIVKAVEGNMVS